MPSLLFGLMREDFFGGAPSAGSNFWSFSGIPWREYSHLCPGSGLLALEVCLYNTGWVGHMLKKIHFTSWNILGRETCSDTFLFDLHLPPRPQHCYKPLMFLFLCSKPLWGEFCILFWRYSLLPGVPMSTNILSDTSNKILIYVQPLAHLGSPKAGFLVKSLAN